MFNKEELKYYELISLLQSTIDKSEFYYDGIKNGLKTIIESSYADFVSFWCLNGDNLHPYYWLSPFDFTNIALSPDNEIIHDVLSEGKTVFFADFKKEADSYLQSKFGALDISSLVIVPVKFSDGIIGAIFFMSKDGTFGENDINLFELLSLLSEMSFNKSTLSSKPWENKEIILSCKSICKSFRNNDIVTQVLNGINFNIFKGEFLCILGESGCGKSTFLNIIGGMERLDSGSFEFFGKEYQNASDSELTEFRRNNIGFVFQSYNLMPNLTCRQNLDLVAELVNDPLDSMKALELVGLSDKEKSYPSQLSGGQQQRVSIARALVKKPSVILADEPTAALDYKTSIDVLLSFAEVVKSGTTLVMVTHNKEITKMADRVVSFRNGKVYEVTINENPKSATELVW